MAGRFTDRLLAWLDASLAQLYKSHPPLDAWIDRIDQRGYGALEIHTARD